MTVEEMRNDLFIMCSVRWCKECKLDKEKCKNRDSYIGKRAFEDEEIMRLHKIAFPGKYEKTDKEDKNSEKMLNDLKEIIENPIKDSGDRTQFNDGKDDKCKPILSRVPSEAIYYIAEARAYGCEKYKEDSWKTVDAQRHFEAALRHIEEMRKNYKAVDKDSGLEHIKHALCDLAFVAALMEMEKEEKYARNII